MMRRLWTRTGITVALSTLAVSAAVAQTARPAVEAVAFEIAGGEAIPAERGSFAVPKNRTPRPARRP